MGKRGPKPTPTAMLKVRGSWLVNNRKDEPTTEVGVPDAPLWLNEQSREHFVRLAEQIAAMGILSVIDGEKLAAYCAAYDKLIEATKFVNEHGHWYESEFGPKKHPASAVQDAALDKVNRLGALFGLSPSDRVGLKVEGKKNQEDGKAKYFEA